MNSVRCGPSVTIAYQRSPTVSPLVESTSKTSVWPGSTGRPAATYRSSAAHAALRRRSGSGRRQRDRARSLRSHARGRREFAGRHRPHLQHRAFVRVRNRTPSVAGASRRRSARQRHADAASAANQCISRLATVQAQRRVRAAHTVCFRTTGHVRIFRVEREVRRNEQIVDLCSSAKMKLM